MKVLQRKQGILAELDQENTSGAKWFISECDFHYRKSEFRELWFHFNFNIQNLLNLLLYSEESCD
jgi:hypothetical protein